MSSLPPHSTWIVWHLQSSNPRSAIVTVVFDNDLRPYPICSVPVGSVTRETATTVQIGLVAPVPPGSMCGSPGIRAVYSIHLKQPLGARRIVPLISPSGFQIDTVVPLRLPRARRLTSREIALVAGLSSTLTTAAGSWVEVWKGTGREIWHALNPRAKVTASTKVWLGSDELLLVVCTDHPNASGYDEFPGAPPPRIGEVQVVFDETTGSEVTRRYLPLPPHASHMDAPTTLIGLGEPTRLMPPPTSLR